MIGRIQSEVYTLLLAVQFLTRLPIATDSAYSSQRMAASVRYYPLVGVFIGAIAAALFFAADYVFPMVVAIILSTVLTILLTGAFHEDGLADTFDGVGGGLTRERALEIMKDSRIGTYGGLALVSMLALKVAALTGLTPAAITVCLIAGHGLSRWSSVVVIATSDYVRASGTAKPTAEGIGAGSMLFASVVALACIAGIAYLLSPLAAAGAVAGLVVGHGVMRWIYQPKIGGYTGDCLGAVQQVSEVGIYLGVLACL
ncbi:MAG: adenosylcobinamide-GDP ribazoletransferase [Pseudomonadota bacterium]